MKSSNQVGTGEVRRSMTKEKRVRDFIKRQNLDALLLTKQYNFAWYTDGGDNHVVSTSDDGSAALVVTREKKYVITSNIESPRIMEEETGRLEFESISFDWFKRGFSAWTDKDFLAQQIEELDAGSSIGSDAFIPGTIFVDDKLINLRLPLSGKEMERFRWIGGRASRCLTEVCGDIRPGLTEHEIASRVAEQCMPYGITPTVILVGTDDRIFKYRHPVPTDKKLERYAMIVVCCRRWGLTASLTRSVHFGEVPQSLREKQNAVAKVDATFIENSRPGKEVSEIFKAAVRAYSEVGYPDEWRKHHQGGAAGYREREYVATPDSRYTVMANQAMAWNPTVSGAKSEDTILVTGEGKEILTEDPEWPKITVEVAEKRIARPDILVR